MYSAFLAVTLIAQDTLVLTRPDCPFCRIAPGAQIVLAGEDRPLVAGSQQVVVRPGSREAVVIDASYRTLPVLVEPTGRTRAFLRRGAGPGEGQMIQFGFHLGLDTFALVDVALRRVSLFDWSGKFARSFPLTQTVHSAVGLDGGEVLFTGESSRRDRLTSTLFRYGASGEAGRPWPATRTTTPWGLPSARAQLAVGIGGQVWVGQVWYSPVIEIRSATGRVERTVRLDVPWFRTEPGPRRPDPSRPERPRDALIAMATRDSLVLLLYRVAAPDWEKGVVRRYDRESRRDVYVPLIGRAAYDGWLLAFHATTGRWIAAQRFDEPPVGLSSAGDLLLFRRSEGDDESSTAIAVLSLHVPPSPILRSGSR